MATEPMADAGEALPAHELPPEVPGQPTSEPVSPEAGEATAASGDRGDGSPAPDRDALERELVALRQQVESLSTVAQQAEVWRRAVAALTGVQSESARPARSPEEQKIVDRLFTLLPELPRVLRLAEIADRLLEAPTLIDGWRQREQQYWDTVAQTHFERIYDHAAAELLGSAAKRDQLDELARAALRHAYVAFIKADPARSDRYVSGDGRLPDEFWQAYRQAAIEPIRRSAASAGPSGPSRQPRGGPAVAVGSSGAPRPGASPSGAPEDEDAIFKQSYQALREALA